MVDFYVTFTRLCNVNRVSHCLLEKTKLDLMHTENLILNTMLQFQLNNNIDPFVDLQKVQEKAQIEVINQIGSGEIINFSSLKEQVDYCCNQIQRYRLDLNKKFLLNLVEIDAPILQKHLSSLA